MPLLVDQVRSLDPIGCQFIAHPNHLLHGKSVLWTAEAAPAYHCARCTIEVLHLCQLDGSLPWLAVPYKIV